MVLFKKREKERKRKRERKAVWEKIMGLKEAPLA